MKAKTLLAVILLVFVAAGVAVLAAKALRGARDGDANAGEPLRDGVMVYYFHGNTRCPTCQTIESYAHEAVQAGFAEELNNGRLRWQVLNYEQPGNEHFDTDYQIVAPTVILARFQGGKQTAWKNLNRVWELVGDKKAFLKYVQDELRGCLESP